MLPPEHMPKRETIGQRLKRARLEQGITVAELRERILQAHRAEIGATTIRDIEINKSPNPGIKTIELIALGLGLDPMEVIGLGLDDPPELEQGYKETQFAQLGRTYRQILRHKRPFADELIKMLIAQMERWR